MSQYECNENSCCSESEHSHANRYQGSECGVCRCGCECHKRHKYCDQLLKIADEAWMEVLQDLIKEEILKKSKEHLKKMAELVCTTNHKRWSEKMAERGNMEAFEMELKSLMISKKK